MPGGLQKNNKSKGDDENVGKLSGARKDGNKVSLVSPVLHSQH